MLDAGDTRMSNINAGPTLTELQVPVMALFIGSNVYFGLLYYMLPTYTPQELHFTF